MQTIGVRIVVVDRRRLIREGLPAVLRAVPDVEVVDAVASIDDLHIVSEPYDVVITNVAPNEVALAVDVPVLTYDDTQPIEVLVGTLFGDRSATAIHPGPSPARRLTPREAQVMRCIADGLSSAEIAEGLDIATKSVENHKQRIFTKLQVRSQAHAVTVSLAEGLLIDPAGGGVHTAGPGLPTRR